MTHVDLFSGRGGFTLAAKWVWKDEYEPLCFCEKDKYCQGVLKRDWPDVHCYEDINIFDGSLFSGRTGLLTGGFPCQPYSLSGARLGNSDDRALWPKMFGVIKRIRPTWIIGENVTNITNMALTGILSDLESAGYSVQPIIIPACAVNSPQIRKRIWILGHANGERRQTRNPAFVPSIEKGWLNGRRWEDFRVIGNRRAPQFPLCGVADGLPRNNKAEMKAFGNAIVPQVAAVIMQGIKQVELSYEKISS